MKYHIHYRGHLCGPFTDGLYLTTLEIPKNTGSLFGGNIHSRIILNLQLARYILRKSYHHKAIWHEIKKFTIYNE